MTDMPKSERRIERGSVSMTVDGVAYHLEHTVISIDDWRETPLGLINFGHVYWGPWRRVRTPLDSTPT